MAKSRFRVELAVSYNSRPDSSNCSRSSVSVVVLVVVIFVVEVVA